MDESTFLPMAVARASARHCPAISRATKWSIRQMGWRSLAPPPLWPRLAARQAVSFVPSFARASSLNSTEVRGAPGPIPHGFCDCSIASKAYHSMIVGHQGFGSAVEGSAFPALVPLTQQAGLGKRSMTKLGAASRTVCRICSALKGFARALRAAWRVAPA